MKEPSLSELALANLATACDVILLRGGSVIDSEQELPDATRRRFLLFSLSKTITAVATLVAVEAGAFDLDTRVAAVIPEFGTLGKENVTIHEVLTHSGGFPDGRPGVPALTFADFGEPGRALKIFCELPFDASLTGRGVYHGLGFGVVADVIERATGESFDALCRRSIFEPLRMYDTTWGLPEAVRDEAVPLVGPHVDHLDVDSLCRFVIPAGNAFSTAADMAQLMLMLRGGGTLDGQRVLGEATVAAMTTPHVAAHGQAGAASFGYGLFIGSEPGSISGRGTTASPSCFGHPGYTSTQAWFDPPVDVTLVALTNSCVPQDLSDQRFSDLADAARVRAARVSERGS